MLNFDYQNPTKILFGKGQIAALTAEIPKDSKVLMLYGGGSIKNNGIYNQVTETLKNHEYLEFGGIPPNPEYEVLLKALKIIKEEKIDFLLAVGGGSVIDGTKFLASAALFEGDEPWSILKDGIRTFEALPFGAVLTLPATGSEMNSGAVVTRSETKEKLGMGGPGLFPKFSVLDPQVVASIPERQLANGIADAFTHVMEQYMTYPAGGLLQDRIAESIMQTLIEVAPRIIKDPTNYEAASNYMWSCTMALNGLIQKGVPSDWVIHMIGHELTALFKIDHARTLTIIGPSHYRYHLESKKEKLAQFGRRIWGLTGDNDEKIAENAIDHLEQFFYHLGLETKLSDYDVDSSNTASAIAETFTSRGWVKMGERKDVTPDDVKIIVEMAL